MKRIIAFFCISMFSFINIDARTGNTIGTFSGARRCLQTNYDAYNYENGGLTVFYDAFPPFDIQPRVVVSIQLNENSSLTDPYMAVITANTTTEAIIKVYKLSGGVVTEAVTDEVIVTIFVVENETTW